MDENVFNSIEDECCFWKERANKINQEKIDVQREFEDFSEESRQLEAELEASILQSEKQIRDLNQTVNQLRNENESMKKKLSNIEIETNSLEIECKQVTKEKDNLKSYVRELEQKNDDLERANRVATESVAGFEIMLNQAYEKNALLECEIDDKERMQVKLQRLMDEARDLKQELKVRHIKPSDDEGEDKNGITNEKIYSYDNSNTINSEQDISTNNKKINIANKNNRVTEQTTTTPADLMNNTISSASPISPSLLHKNDTNRMFQSNSTNILTSGDKVSTLNIVADLLRRLDNMEAKLKAWKIRKPSTNNNHHRILDSNISTSKTSLSISPTSQLQNIPYE